MFLYEATEVSNHVQQESGLDKRNSRHKAKYYTVQKEGILHHNHFYLWFFKTKTYLYNACFGS